ncbi:TPA: hypothetical protein QHC21_005712 [Raoultella planticola]|nr:hypothetical protein [Raoultella planticola]HDT6041500.1 hypothetical protein [Raoultella planticola]HDT6045128.1 hypothetical protein [Raoultella planticola]
MWSAWVTIKTVEMFLIRESEMGTVIRKGLLAGALQIFILSFIGYSSLALSQDDKTLRDKSRKELINLMLQELKDPYSADVKIVKESPSHGEVKMICGLVNAKNGYGAYMGFSKFYVREDQVTIVATEGGKKFITNAMWDICDYVP